MPGHIVGRYIPCGWFHFVEYVTAAISVSCQVLRDATHTRWQATPEGAWFPASCAAWHDNTTQWR